MPERRTDASSNDLAAEMAKRRGKRYPAHAWIADQFPDYVKVLVELDEVIRLKPRRFDQKMHELFHIVALAVKGCRPQVISAFPISPQTHIVESLARMVANGEIDAEYIPVESEFSAASVLAGASAAGSRSYTASSSQGLLLIRSHVNTSDPNICYF